MTATAETWLIDPRRLVPGDLVPPVSKSDAQRALVLAHLLRISDWPKLPDTPGARPADVLVLERGLQTLERMAAGAVVPGEPVEIDCADGGAPFRILLGQAAVIPGAHVRFTGTPRLGARPHGPLFRALRATLEPCGFALIEGDPWPLELRTGAVAPGDVVQPRFRVDAAESSQYATSLLLAAARLYLRERRPWTVELTGPAASEGYLALTVDWLRAVGFEVRLKPGEVELAGWRPPARPPPAVPGDWSSLGYLLLVAWRSGGTVADVDLAAPHPDAALVELLGRRGVEVKVEDGRASVTGQLAVGLQASGAHCPDLLPTLAALACVAPEPSVLREVEILRGKESDRLQGIIDLVTAFGGRAWLEGTGTLHLAPPVTPPRKFRFDSRGDHRLAMAAATLSVLSGSPLLLKGPECVSKSFPDFWAQLGASGVSWTALFSGAAPGSAGSP